MEGISFSRNVWMVAKAIVEAKMSFYHWIIRRDITDAKDWKAKSAIRGLVPYRECRFNELTEDDLGSLMIICKRKDQKTETHLLSDDEVDELAVLLGINFYSAEDHRIFITEVINQQKRSSSKSSRWMHSECSFLSKPFDVIRVTITFLSVFVASMNVVTFRSISSSSWAVIE